MERRIILKRFICVLVIGLTLITLTACANKKHEENKKFVVAEVTHSVFYAPWYVAIHNNYFENLDIEVILTSGANNVVAAVLSILCILFTRPRGMRYACSCPGVVSLRAPPAV